MFKRVISLASYVKFTSKFERMIRMFNTLKRNTSSLLKDAFYDLTILLISHWFYQIITQLLK